jgi:hypothetical protein
MRIGSLPSAHVPKFVSQRGMQFDRNGRENLNLNEKKFSIMDGLRYIGRARSDEQKD